MKYMSSVENNPVYFIEEDPKRTKTSYYRSENQALLNKATQGNGNHKKIFRLVVVVILLLIAITCVALIQAFARGNEPLNEGPSVISSTNKQALDVELIKVDVEKGDTLWSIANQYAPNNVSVQSYIHKLKKVNGLKESSIQEGQMLVLPNL
jgi:LysM repeat protein